MFAVFLGLLVVLGCLYGLMFVAYLCGALLCVDAVFRGFDFGNGTYLGFGVHVISDFEF